MVGWWLAGGGKMAVCRGGKMVTGKGVPSWLIHVHVCYNLSYWVDAAHYKEDQMALLLRYILNQVTEISMGYIFVSVIKCILVSKTPCYVPFPSAQGLDGWLVVGAISGSVSAATAPPPRI